MEITIVKTKIGALGSIFGPGHLYGYRKFCDVQLD